MDTQEWTYGPFSVRVEWLAGPIVCVLAAPLFIVMGCQSTEISCTRAAAVTCTVRSWPFSEQRDAFALRGVRSSYERRSGKGQSYHEVGRVLLRDATGREHASIEVGFQDSRTLAGKLSDFMKDANAHSFAGSVHGPRFAAFFGIAALVVAFIVGRAGLRGAGRARLSWSAERRRLRVRRSFLGIPVSLRDIDVSSVSRVDVEWKQFKEPLGSRLGAAETAGRVRVFTRAGCVALLPTFARGERVHLETAEQLRRWFGLSATEPAHSPPPRVPGYDWSSGFGRFAAVWVGASIGSLAGIALGVVGALTLGGAKLADPAGGAWYFGGLFVGVVAGIALALHLTSRRRLSR